MFRCECWWLAGFGQQLNGSSIFKEQVIRTHALAQLKLSHSLPSIGFCTSKTWDENFCAYDKWKDTSTKMEKQDRGKKEAKGALSTEVELLPDSTGSWSINGTLEFLCLEGGEPSFDNSIVVSRAIGALTGRNLWSISAGGSCELLAAVREWAVWFWKRIWADLTADLVLRCTLWISQDHEW